MRYIEGQESELKEVFTNIIINAVDAMPEGGVLSVFGYKNMSNVVVEISDTGKGMNREIMKKIFNPFFTTKPTGEGTGLGLSLCHDIVSEMHKGQMTVNSKKGEYTEFIVLIPNGKN